jgi:predicted kinase
MRWVVAGNREGLAEFGAEVLDPAARRKLIDESNLLLERWSDLLDARRNAGYVRHGHGDLHLRNIVLLEGRPVLFDGVEFNDEISCTDVLYDLAFLLMDLWRRCLGAHANRVFNEYLAQTEDVGGLALVPLFLSCRAAVRAKTSLTAARIGGGARRPDLERTAREYLAMALRFLRPPPPLLLAIGGLSGSGKSSVAQLLAPAIGAAPGSVILRSDAIRKRLCGVPITRPLGADGYTDEVSRRVYEIMADRAREIVGSGHSAIADATYLDAGDRATVERIAADAGVRFVGCWLDAPESTLVARVNARVADPSDANADVIRRQCATPIGTIGWHRVDASQPLSTVVDALSDVLDLPIDET